MRVKILLIFALCLLPFAIFGQISEEMDRINSDSLLKALPELEGTEKIDTLNKIAFRIVKDFPDSCRKIATQTISMSESQNYQKGLADGYRNMGISYMLADSLFPAMVNFLNAVRIYEQIDPSIELANIYVVLSFMNNFTGRFQSAIKYEQKAIDVYKQINNNEEKADRYHSIARAYMWLEEYDSAIYYNELAISNADSALQAYLYNTFGTIFLIQFYKSADTSLLDRSVDWFIKGFNLLEIDDHQSAGINSNLFHAYYAYGKKEMDSIARDHLKQVIPSAMKTKEAFYTIPSNWLWQGKLFMRDGNYDSAIIFYNKGLEMVDSALSNFSMSAYPSSYSALGNRYWLKRHKADAYSLLYGVYSTIGDHKKALEYYINYNNASDEIYQEDTKSLLTILEAESENEKISNQISLLAKENEVKDLRINLSNIFIYGLGGLMVILLLGGVIFIRQRKIRQVLNEQKLKHDLELKKVEADKLKELDKMKSRFFANISHEFRTPLTLILGPLDKLRSYLRDEEPEKDLDLIKRNAKRLQNLINQLLNLSKLESGKMKLRVKEEDIISLSKGYTQSFESLAKQRDIKLKFKSNVEVLPAYIDKDKYEKILFNLISNAFKFTQKRGRIAVQVDSIQLTVDGKKTADHQPSTANHIIVTIADTGRGISPEILPHIFDRFYQADDLSNNYQEGTGIGLALSKELVELHHGTIEVESELEKGTTLILTLPTGKDHYKPEDFIFIEEPEEKEDNSFITIEEESYADIVFEPTGNKEVNEEEVLTEEDKKPLLLVVEDNKDMRYYIRSNISGDFRLTEAEDGEKGYEKAIDKVPDLIISDVMMPKMDGMELCRKLKMDKRTSHIPVIMLTAKASLEDRLEGLETGADDFLTKPFDHQELQVRVKNLIIQRKKLQEKFLQNAKQLGISQVLNLPESGFNSIDRKFLSKAVEIVNAHMDDEEFTIETFRKELAMGKTQLHKKLKSLVGQPPSAFIRTIRLNRAAEMLKANKGSVSEIAFEVGFNNLSYFSKCFLEQFGVSPSEFRS